MCTPWSKWPLREGVKSSHLLMYLLSTVQTVQLLLLLAERQTTDKRDWLIDRLRVHERLKNALARSSRGTYMLQLALCED
jgi:hypothetical protein